MYLKVSDYAPLLEKVSTTLRSWSGLNLSYAKKVEVIKQWFRESKAFSWAFYQSQSRFWIKLLDYAGGSFWGDGKAKVAWKTMCLEKQFGGLGLRDTKTWNEALLTKTLWNIHSKKDSLWCKWVHHIYIKGGSLWTILPKNSFPPLM